jgi:pimeloyl-ACP methyl ester carboxylesterase
MKNLYFFSIFFITTTFLFAQEKSVQPFEFVKSGSGNQTIIFIPGFASSGDVWNETIAIYEKDYTCYKFTMAGFAGTEITQNPSFRNWETGIVKFIKDNKIHKPIIIGHSLGGGLALAIASNNPNLVEKMIIVDALPYLAALTNPNAKQLENIDCSSTVNQFMNMSEEQFYQMQKTSMPYLIQNSDMIETVINWSVKSDRETFARIYCDFSNTDLRDEIENIKCPTLILLESHFKGFKPAIEEQYKNLKNAEFQYANKGLHFIMFDDKDWYFEQLSNFLSNK